MEVTEGNSAWSTLNSLEVVKSNCIWGKESKCRWMENNIGVKFVALGNNFEGDCPNTLVNFVCWLVEGEVA